MGASWEQRVAMARKHMRPEHGDELERIERSYREDHGDMARYLREHERLGAKMLLARAARKLPFPGGAAVEYAQAKRGGIRLNPREEKHARAVAGRAQFERWYGELREQFEDLMRTLSTLRGPDATDADRALCAALEGRGHELYRYYRSAKSLGDIPWLPPAPRFGTGRGDLLDTWERFVRERDEDLSEGLGGATVENVSNQKELF